MSEFFYTASQDAQAVSTAVDVFHITIADDKPIRLWELQLYNSSDLGDANEEVLRLGLYTAVTGGGAGSALTEVAMADHNSMTPGTAVVGQGTASTGGTLRKVFYWNIRQAGPVWIATPQTAIRIGQAGSAAAIRLLAAPADAITMGGEITWGEV